MRILRIALVLAASAAAMYSLFLPVQHQTQLQTVTLLHFNDIHGSIEESSIHGVCPCPPASVAARQCFGGYARLAAQVDAERQRRRHPTLVLNAGDEMVGTVWDVVYSGQASPPFLNAMGVDAMALGNHDFGHGLDALARFVATCDFPVLAPCNMDAASRPELAALLHDHVVRDLGGLQVALVAYITPSTSDTAPPGHNLGFAPIVPALTAAVRRLRAARPDVRAIIALGHAGYEVDQAVAAAVPGLSMVVGGHSHTLLANGSIVLDSATKRQQAPNGPYPTWVAGPGGRMVPVVQAYFGSRYLGKALVTFGAQGQVVDVAGGPILLGAPASASSPKHDVVDLVDSMGQRVATYANTVIGHFAQPGGRLDHANRHYGDTPVGNLITQAMLWYLKAHTTVEATAGAVTIAWLNAGDIRDSLLAEAPDSRNITRQALAAVLPYPNTLAVKRVTGADLLWSLEHGVSGRPPPGRPTSGGFAATWGLRYAYDWALPPGSRIISAQVHASTTPPTQAPTHLEPHAWAPLRPCTAYLVAMNDYAAAGGDGHARLAAAPLVLERGPAMDLVVSSYLAAASPVEEVHTEHIGCCPHNPAHPLCAPRSPPSPQDRTCTAARRA